MCKLRRRLAWPRAAAGTAALRRIGYAAPMGADASFSLVGVILSRTLPNVGEAPKSKKYLREKFITSKPPAAGRRFTLVKQGDHALPKRFLDRQKTSFFGVQIKLK